MKSKDRPTITCQFCHRLYVLDETNVFYYTFDNPEFNYFEIFCNPKCEGGFILFDRELPKKLQYLYDIVCLKHDPEPPNRVVTYFEKLYDYTPLMHRELEANEANEALMLRNFFEDDDRLANLVEFWATEAS